MPVTTDVEAGVAKTTAQLDAAAVLETLAASGVPKAVLAKMRDFAEYVASYEAVLAGQIAEQILAVYGSAITAPRDPVALVRAEEHWREAARIRAHTLAVELTQSQLKSMGMAISEGLEAGEHPFTIARRLSIVTELDPPRAGRLMKYQTYLDANNFSSEKQAVLIDRMKEKLLRDRRKTIARTESSFACSEANRQKAVGRGARYKAWMTSRDNRVSPECQMNEAAGVIRIDETFPSGHLQPPAHPNCRCSLVYVSKNEDAELLETDAERWAHETETAVHGGNN
jgi:SPP1 gp7 family putative phage head morphogenesis protein